jgi:hypothetical protein
MDLRVQLLRLVSDPNDLGAERRSRFITAGETVQVMPAE